MINITCFNNKRGLSYKSLRNGLEEIPPNWFRVKICHLFFSLRVGGFDVSSQFIFLIKGWWF